MLTSGHKLTVTNSSHIAQLTVDGGGTTFPSITVGPASSGGGLLADQIFITAGGRITSAKGITSRTSLRIAPGGKLAFTGSGCKSLVVFSAHNDGHLMVEGGVVEVLNSSGTSPSFDPDGTIGRGMITVKSGARLHFSRGEPIDDFAGTMVIGSGSGKAYLVISRSWTNEGVVVLDDGLLEYENEATSDYRFTNVGEIRIRGTLNEISTGIHGFSEPWTNEGVVVLEDGTLGGGAVLNNGEIRGHGTLNNIFLNNNGLISAEGGTLFIEPEESFDLDGPNDTGSLNALTGSLEFDAAAAFDIRSFAGELAVGTGHEIRAKRVGFLLAPGSVVRLTGGALITAGLRNTGDIDIHDGAGPESRSESVEFDPVRPIGNVILDGDLRLVGISAFGVGTVFSGDGTLIFDSVGDHTVRIGSVIATGFRNEGSLLIPSDDRIGQIAFGGGYTQTADGSLNLRIGGLVPAKGHDRIAVGGAADLAGTLTVTLVNGFIPRVGNSFTMLVATGGLAGTFDKFQLPALGTDLFWHPGTDSAVGTFTLSVCSRAADIDMDCMITLADFAGFTDCAAGPNVPPNPLPPLTADDCLAAFDFDGDGDNDLVDYAELERRLTQ